MRQWAQFSVTDGWSNDTVTNMLLICEHLHDLDMLLLGDEKDGNKRIETDHGYKLDVQMSSIISALFLYFVML